MGYSGSHSAQGGQLFRLDGQTVITGFLYLDEPVPFDDGGPYFGNEGHEVELFLR